MEKKQMRILLSMFGLVVLLQIAIYRTQMCKYSIKPTDMDHRLQPAQVILTNSSIKLSQNVFAGPNNNSATWDNIVRGLSSASEEDLSLIIAQLQALKRGVGNDDNDSNSDRVEAKIETSSAFLKTSTDGVTDSVEYAAQPRKTESASHYSISNPKHWIPDWENQTDLYQVLVNRRKTIDDRCESLQPYSYPLKGQQADPLIERSRFVGLCTTAKAGSKFWKAFLQTQRRIEKNQKSTGKERTVMFVVSRNPWHRLVSAWNDKFNMEGGIDKYWMKKWCRGKSWESCPPFNVFVSECVLKLWKRNRVDIHWAPVINRCQRCEKNQPITFEDRWDIHWAPVIDRCQICDKEAPIRFDYIVSAENMNEEAVAMFEHENAGIPNIREQITGSKEQAMRPSERQHVTARYQFHYQNVSAQDIEELKQIYGAEIYLFGYPDTPFVDFERS